MGEAAAASNRALASSRSAPASRPAASVNDTELVTWSTPPSAASMTLSPILSTPFAETHRFWSGEVAETMSVARLFRPGPFRGTWTIDHGGGGDATRFVCGFIESSEFLLAPVFRSLPPLLIERTGDNAVSALISSTVGQIVARADAAAPGRELMLGR
jgi:hypothetical protein